MMAEELSHAHVDGGKHPHSLRQCCVDSLVKSFKTNLSLPWWWDLGQTREHSQVKGVVAYSSRKSNRVQPTFLQWVLIVWLRVQWHALVGIPQLAVNIIKQVEDEMISRRHDLQMLIYFAF